PDISGQQSVETYSVALSDNLPSFDLGVRASATTTDTVTIVPGCQALDTQVTQTFWRACGLMQLRVGPTTDPNTGATYGLPYDSNFTYGSFTIVWADSAYGADYDVDAVQVLTFCVGANCSNTQNVTDPATGVTVNVGTQMCSGVLNNSNFCQNGQFKSNANIQPQQVLVRTQGIYDSTYMPMRLGYSVAGPNNSENGFHQGTTITGNGDLAYGSSIVPPPTWNPPDVAKWSTGPSQQNLLPTPLFLAAKYGGFTYPNGASNPLPTDVSQWDQINNETGAKGSDGLPDNFFPVRNPSQLAARLSTVFQAILKRAGSGTAAAVVANEREGIGATYQALYEPSRTDNQGRSVSWVGSLQALFVDSKGRLREDPNGTHQLVESDFTANPVVQIVYDTNTNTTVVHRWTVDPDTSPNAFVTLPLDQLAALWNARDQLASNLLTAGIAANRTYSANAGTGRYIITCIDTSLSGCSNSEVQPFEAGTFTNNNYGILNVSSRTQAQQVVNYIRGQEQTGMRNRTIDYFNNGQTEIMRLGDIVDSTPTVVGAPSESFDVLYNDQTYRNFFEQYKNRRNVVYVGADDGMLHAFNGGFYNQATHTFDTAPPNGQSGTADPLGSELWAYVPFNLLPHLQWLTDPTYTHVWYVDDKPRVIDARVFNADATHPDGWGTVLVVGMRMGGANLSLPAGIPKNGNRISANSGFSDFGTALSGANITQITTHSAYVVMDITNPEQPPTLLAEISDPDTSAASKIGFTTSYPTVMAFRPDPTATSGDHWYLIFGNGPTDLQTATSSNDASLFVYDLSTRQPVSGFPKDLHTALDGSTGTAYASSFVGDPVSVDWNLDFDADAVYVGTAGGTAASPTGRLVKLTTGCLSGASACSSPGNWTVTTLLNPNVPPLATPTVTQDEQGHHWIMDGTGRLFVGADKASSTQQYLFGVIDTLDGGASSPPSFANLVDTTDAQVATNGSVSGVTFSGQSVTDEVSLAAAAASAGGWKLSLPTNGSNPSERSLSSGDLIGNIFFDSTYVPDLSDCLSLGESSLFGLFFKTGAASQAPVFGTRQIVINGNTTTVSIGKIDLGKGLGAAPTLHLGTTANGQVTVFTQTSTGAIVQSNAQVGPSAKSGETDWREDHGP
ncbi:MAG: hypothetical protein KGJ55_12100, partial [Gammaproteobacteria bacterium]|nr:hypothetical protein [Gammaproteobacteria bacterium]